MSFSTHASVKSLDGVLLQKGKIAPFSGALFPEMKFQAMETALFQLPVAKNELSACLKDLTDCELEGDGQLKAGAAGFLAGLVLYYIISTARH